MSLKISNLDNYIVEYAKSVLNFGYPSSSNDKLLFNLEIFGSQLPKKTFRNVEIGKYSILIDSTDEILYSNIKYFKVCVSNMNLQNPIMYNLEGQIDKNNSSYTQTNGFVHIEFTKNYNGFTICNCYFNSNDVNKIFISPPN
jgi:hypothetical protein